MNQIKSLGRYEIVKELGRGGMGIVLKGRDPKIDRMVALKIIKLSDVGDSDRERELLERFFIEARAAGKLTHPNIVTVYDVGEEAGMSFIAMEFVEGRDLASLLKERKKLPFREAARLVTQVAEGLAFAHEQGIIHRDIKPGNIMLTQKNAVKITDFGLARLQSAGSVTQTGHAVGSPLYMSPEQVQGQPVDGQSDIFSMGVMFYEMVTGKKPFEAETLTSIIFKIIQDTPPPVTQFDASLPDRVSAIIARMMAKDKKDRYKTCHEVVTALRAMAELPEDFSSLTDSDATRTAAMTLDMATGAAPKKGAPMGLIAAGVAAMVLAGGAYFALAPSGETPEVSPPAVQAAAAPPVAAPARAPEPPPAPEPALARIVSAPAGAELSIDGKRAGVTPFESGELAPGKHRYVATLHGHADARGEFEIVKDKPFTLNIALASAFGDIAVDAPKGATVEINGAAVGQAPFTGRLAEGTHKVAVSLKGYKPFAASAKITAGQKTDIAAKLEKLGFGAIRFTASPWADIYVNNEKVGSTPKVMENIPEGQVTVKLVNPAYKPFSQTVRLAANETAAVSHAFTEAEMEAAEGAAAAPAKTGSLKITATPAGQVFVDGKAHGETPVVVTDLAAGPHTVVVRRPGLSDYKREINIIEDFVTRLAVE